MSIEIDGFGFWTSWEFEKKSALSKVQGDILDNKKKWATRIGIYFIYFVVTTLMFHNIFANGLFIAVGVFLFYHHYQTNKQLKKYLNYLESKSQEYWINTDFQKTQDEKEELLNTIPLSKNIKRKFLL